MSEFDPYYKWLGIPPEEQPPNHYRLLAIPLFTDDPDVISNSADQRMLHIRTYQTGPRSALSQTLLNEIARANSCLLRPESKAEYDETLRRTLTNEPDASPPSKPPPMLPTPVDEATAPIPDETFEPDPLAPLQIRSRNRGSTLLPSGYDPLAPLQIRSPKVTGKARVRHRRNRNRSILTIAVLAAGSLPLLVIAFVLFARIILNCDSPGSVSPSPKETAASNKSTGDSKAPPTTGRLGTLFPEGASGTNRKSPDVAENSKQKPPEPAVTNEPIDDQAIDLLKLVDVGSHRLSGTANFADDQLILEGGGGAAFVTIPYAPPTEYELEVHATRMGGDGSLCLAIVVDGRPCMLIVDGWPPNYCTALQFVDEALLTARSGRVLEQGREAVVVAKIGRDTIRLYCDGNELLNWQGDPKRLTVHTDYSFPNPRYLYLGIWETKYRISSVTLRTPELTDADGSR
jgi:hypothetical protein